MKKSFIIVVIIAILVLVVLIVLNQSKSTLNTKVVEARTNAVHAGLNAFVAGTMADLAKYDGDAKNTIPFDQNPTIKQGLEVKLAAIKDKDGGDFSYKIYDESDASVKASDASRGIYVCFDTKTIKPTDIPADSFNNPTDCAGGSLK
ncbi:MAG: hypothetical protein JWP09_162 [Candidatus Taylorbacteria bacterium]|nr:hypothetical protein [Candidatus Taylorbacteria bacterium]